MTHNDIQKLCSGDEIDFAFGEVYGLRQWNARMPSMHDYQDLQLVGHFSKQWDLGTNVAECYAAQGGVISVPVVPDQQFGKHPIGTNPIDIAYDHVLTQFRAWNIRIEDLDSLRVDGGEDGGLYSMTTKSWTSGMQGPARSFSHSPKIFRTPGRLVLGKDKFQPRIKLDHIKSDGSRVYIDLDNGSSTVYYNVEQYTAMRISMDTASPLFYEVTWKLGEACSSVAQPGCVCGFYAYTDIESIIVNSYGNTASVFGLVRGHGKVTIGTKGFRAEKADIVALAAPVHYKSQYPHSSNKTLDINGNLTLKWEPASAGSPSLKDLERLVRGTDITLFENPAQLLEFARVQYGLTEV